MESDGYNLSYLDLLMNTLGCFIFLFAIILLLVNPIRQNDGVEKKAEFLIITEWDKESLDDVDSYLQDPSGNICYYQRREDGLMHLDRDDRGKVGDEVKKENGESVTFQENTETVSIRAILTGEYVFNVHMFSKRDTDVPTEVDVKIIKLNPKVKVVASKKVTLNNNGEEITVFRFSVGADGNVHDITDLPKKFTQTHGYPPEDYDSEGDNE
jgi:hypothetical protein